MTQNVYYQKDELPIDFFGSEYSHNTVCESEKDKTVDKSKKNSRLLPTQLMLLLPPIAAQVLYYLFGFSLNSDGKNYFYQRTFNSLKMTEDEFDTALQTLIDIGIVDVTRRDETKYDYIVKYDKIKKFNFPFKEMLNMDKIKLSTDVRFRNINVNSSNGYSTDLKMNELVRKLDSSQRSELMDMLMVLRAKEMNGEKIEELPSNFFRLSKKNVGKVSE